MGKPINDNRSLVQRTRQAQEERKRQEISEKLYAASLSASWVYDELSTLADETAPQYETLVQQALALSVAVENASNAFDKEV